MAQASVRAAVEHIARTGTITPHQLAAFSRLDERLSPEIKAEFTENWRAQGSPAVPPTPPAELVTLAQATAIFGRPPSSSQLADLNACLRRFQINTAPRMRHFLAQVGHESGGLRWLLELASGDAYEGRKDLGNTRTGDGPRFRGAGAIQLTGRHNYQRFADYINDPDVMEGAAYVASRYPFSSAGFWWQDNRLNALVDGGASCRQVSARVNGRDPAHGLSDREAYYTKAVAAIPAPGKPAAGAAQQERPAATAAERKRWLTAIKALNLSQPDASTCQAACIGMAVGDRDIAGIRRRLLARGKAGSPTVMGSVIREYGRPYRYEGDASLAQCTTWLKNGELLITHGWFTAPGHVICLDGLKQGSEPGRYVFDVKDPWSEFNVQTWRYDLGSKFFDGFYSDLLIYATCVASTSVATAQAAYRRGRVNMNHGGMWVHRFLTA
jgi:predicted chitinase